MPFQTFRLLISETTANKKFYPYLHTLVNFLKGTIKYFSNLVKSSTEAFKHSRHVSTFFHRDHSSVVFFVDPYKEVLIFIVPDAASIGPVTCHARTREKRRDGFIKQEMIRDELFLLCVRHFVEWIIPGETKQQKHIKTEASIALRH